MSGCYIVIRFAYVNVMFCMFGLFLSRSLSFFIKCNKSFSYWSSIDPSVYIILIVLSHIDVIISILYMCFSIPCISVNWNFSFLYTCTFY